MFFIKGDQMCLMKHYEGLLYWFMNILWLSDCLQEFLFDLRRSCTKTTIEHILKSYLKIINTFLIIDVSILK